MTRMMMLNGAPGTCLACFTKHAADEPHNAQSISYMFRFNAAHGRSPTWADAIAHCDAMTQRQCRQVLEQRQAWSEPPAGVAPIAEPMELQA